MSGHPDPRPLLGGDELPQSERAELLRHLQGCAACRAVLAQEDPSGLFSLLALEPIPDTVLARISRGVSDEIAREARRSRSRRRYALGALAASLLLAGFLGLYLRVEQGAPDTSRDPGRLAEREPAPVRLPEEVIPAALLEVLDSPGSADVVQISVGGNVDFIMIFDAEFGL